MFKRYLSAIAPLPQEALWAEQYFQNKEEKHLSKRVLKNLKHEDKLVLFTRQLVTAEQDIDDDKKQALQQFFSVSLVCEPDLREIDLKRLFGCLILDQ
jgi:hypothetical protein